MGPHSKILQEPKQPWEFVQIGNCGSPLETEAGWLVITHGVGPFRQYALGALLLDLDDLLSRRIDEVVRLHETEHAAYYGVMIWILMMLEQWFQQHDDGARGH